MGVIIIHCSIFAILSARGLHF